MSKYARLTDYLSQMKIGELILSFEEIAEIIRAHLPKSAERSRYWENGSKLEQAQGANRAARLSGYKAYLIEGEDKVRFVREL